MMSTSMAVQPPIAIISSSVGVKASSPALPKTIRPPREVTASYWPAANRSTVTVRWVISDAMHPRCQTAGEWLSRVVAERRPCCRPRGPQPGREEDLHALLVVADAKPVPESRDKPNVPEFAPQQRGINVHRNSCGVTRRRWTPQPEVVATAKGLRQPEGRPVPLDSAGLTVVTGENRGQPTLGWRQRVVLASYERDLLGPRDRLGQVIVDLLQRHRAQRGGRQDRQRGRQDDRSRHQHPGGHDRRRFDSTAEPAAQGQPALE